MKRGVGSAVLAMLATLTVVSAAAAAPPPPDKPPSSHSGVPQLSQRAAVVRVAPAEAGKPPEGIDSNVDAVRKAYAVRGKPAALLAAQKRSMRVRGGRLCVVVEAQVGGLGAARASLAALDAQIDSSYDSLIRAYVPVGRIGKLADAPGVMLVRRPMTPHRDVQSQGVGEIGASDWHAEGWTGAGTKVGIVDVGFSGYTAGLGSELPPAAQVLTWGGSGYPEDGGGSHGTAVAEIVHDVAPGATLYLARVEDEVDIGNAVQWLLGQGVDVVNMSLGWPAWGLGDGTGQVNEIVTSAVSAGVFWANSAGNDRLGHWKGDFADANGNDFMDWGVVDSSPWEVNTFWATQGAPILGVLRWQDSWGFADQDYDLGLHRWTGDAWVPVAFGQSVQDGEQEDRPFEEVLTEAAETGIYGWTIYRYDATETAVSFDLNMKDGLLDDPGNPNPYWYDHSRSLSPPADNASDGFMAAAAVGRAPDYIQEPYSAEGPTRDLRVAPEIAAPANVSTSPYDPFGGTSASSPHLAGAAALVLGLSPSWTAAELETYLRSRAVDLGAPGSDFLYGFGRLHLPLPTTPWVVTLDLSDTEVPPGETVTYSGTVKTAGGANGTGTVTVQKRLAGTTSWSNWRTKTLSSGKYAVNVAMTTADREWQFRARMLADASNTTGFSPTKTLTVLPLSPWVVTLDLSDTEVAPGETVTYSGSVKTDGGADGSGTVTVQKRRAGTTSWSNWRTKTLNGDGSYAVNVAMTTADREWEFRTRMPGNASNATGFSPTKSAHRAAPAALGRHPRPLRRRDLSR